MKKMTMDMINAKALCDSSMREPRNGGDLLDMLMNLGVARKVLEDSMDKYDKLSEADAGLCAELDGVYHTALEMAEKLMERVEIFPANIGGYIHTPRFLNVRIDDIISSDVASQIGFVEPTHYKHERFYVRGKSIGENRMIFALVRKDSPERRQF